jgi:formyltetrahydrofolate deformylase
VATGTTAILLLHAPDSRGLIAGIADFIYRHNGNIVDVDQHTDVENGLFFIRAEWQMEGFRLGREQIMRDVAEWARPRDARFRLSFSDEIPRVAIFVSKQDHCLQDLILRHREREFAAELPLIISNHPDLEPVARQYGIPFHVLAVDPAKPLAHEAAALELLSSHRIDTVVLARYMRILSPRMVAAYPDTIINIHHSFLPAFAGGKPYHQAHERGVKTIGATSHYVTAELDQGPIIEQDVVRVTHRDSVEDLVRKGRDLERLVLGRAVRLHLARRVLVNANKTVVFE